MQMKQNNLPTLDAVGKWFSAYKDLNEPFRIGFDFVRDEKREFINVSHIENDGSGAVRKICSQRALDCRVKEAKANFKRPSFITILLQSLKFLWITRPQPEVWPLNIEKCSSDRARRESFVFNENETKKITARAESNSVSLNSFLFFNLNKSLHQLFKISDGNWWIPVNMRSELGIDPNDIEKNNNLVSNFTIDVSQKINLQELHSKIKSCLAEKRHWGTWCWQLSADYLPYSLVKRLALHGIKNNYIGAFSNLGDWSCADRNTLLIPYINTLRSHPLGAGIIIWNGKLCLSLRFYDGLSISDEQIRLLMKTWVENLQS